MPITVGNLGRLQTVSQRGPDLVFSFESSDLVIRAILPNVLRHTWVPTHWRLYTERVTDVYAAARRYWPAGPPARITEMPDKICVEVGDFFIDATREPFHLRYCSADGRPFLEEIEQGGLSWSYWDYTLRYRLAPDDHFYGMGQADQLAGPVDLDHRGRVREIWNQHSPPAVTIFPSLLSLRGYALLVDNTCRAIWDLGHGDPQSFAYQARGGGLQYYVVYGPDLNRVLRAMLARLKQQGFRIVVIEEPYLTLKSRNYPEAIARGYLARHHDGSPYTFDFWPGECALLDLSNPAAREWWSEK